MASIEEKVEKFRVMKISEEKKGLILKSNAYYALLDPVYGKDITREPHKVEIPLFRYEEIEVGSEIDVIMYSGDGKDWWFNRKHAEDWGPID
jgi:predicted nucleotide-binding protein (sugar kinase/HSP70/actin superfamily)